MKLPTLDEIALTTSTDRSSAYHSYCDAYDKLLSPLREKPVRLLELGLLGGDGIRMFAQYFEHPMSVFLGVDIHDRNFQSNDPRIMTVYGDAGNADFLDSLAGPFDLVFEDGSHMWSHQIIAFERLWKKVNPGGIFISEDQHVCHSQVHADFPMNAIQYFARIAMQMQDILGDRGCAKPDPSDMWYDIDSIEFRKGLIIVRKRP